jgi:hypothetical protein
MDYKRILLLGHCEAGTKFVERALRTSERIQFEEHKPLIAQYPKIDMDLLNFMTRENPENKILCSHSTNPKLLCNLNIYDFSSWKFIYIERDIYESFPSGFTLMHNTTKRKFNKVLEHAVCVTSNLNLFYHKIKDKCITIQFGDLFENPIENITSIFKFLKIKPPEDKTILELSERDESIVFMKKTKLEIGHEFQEFFTTEDKTKFNCLLNDHPDKKSVIANVRSVNLIKDIKT